ncbi:hypothetical protein [Amycolatopsis sp. lyj-109]|uniref:hypothetical protein n=1 Tax=Amycolatopsis sp. lyj-109 TaxID=2789287 RepID=UPI00397A5D4B
MQGEPGVLGEFGTGDRQMAVRRLVEYFTGQPEAVQRAMRNWARRHPGTLTNDLTAALPAAP